jgi:predicted nucleic acid-binding protein
MQEGWATCLLTEAGFVRISCQPAATKQVITVREAIANLEASTASHEHQFWQSTMRVTDLLPETFSRFMGPQQLTDALLLNLAIQRGGILSTFDKRMENLPPQGSPNRSYIEVIPINPEI